MIPILLAMSLALADAPVEEPVEEPADEPVDAPVDAPVEETAATQPTWSVPTRPAPPARHPKRAWVYVVVGVVASPFLTVGVFRVVDEAGWETYTPRGRP